MMIRPVELAGIKAGTIDLAFRRWDRPRVVVGTRMRTVVGLVEVTSVEPVDEATITEDDARRAGTSLDALRRGLAARADRPVFRVGLRWAGDDPRIGLRQRPPTETELAEIRRSALLPSKMPLLPPTRVKCNCRLFKSKRALTRTSQSCTITRLSYNWHHV